MIHKLNKFTIKPSVQAIAIALAALGTISAMPVRAQSTEAVMAPQVQEEIVVSASRIDRAGFTAPTPTIVVGAELLEQRATVNIGDVLNEVPAFRGTNTPSAGGLGNSGVVLADLRGLTAPRTLVLLDRNRLPIINIPAAFGQGNVPGTTDLNIIPTALIRSVDVVTGGASAAYGSDAVAGVVNIILNDKLEGIKGNVQYGQTRYGDAKDTFASIAGGTGFAGGKGHIIAGGEYNRNDGTSGFNDQREWGKKSYGVIQNLPSTRPAGTPANIITNNLGTYFRLGSSGGIIQTPGPLFGLAFVKGANGVTTTAPISPGIYSYNTGSSDAFTDAALAANAAAGIDNRNYQQLRPAVERANFLGKLSYQFNDHISGFIEPLVSHVRNVGFSIARRDGAGAGPALRLQNDNPYLQAVLTPAQLAQVPALNPFNTQFAGGLSVGYLGTYFGPAVSNTTNNTTRLLTGLKGNFGETWEWDLSYQNAQNKSDRNITNTFNNNNFRNAVDAIVVGGQVVCRSAAARAAGCQPINILGQPSGSAAAYNYVLTTSSGQSTTRLKEISANLQGEPFSVWAGPVSVGFGLEHRTESLVTTVGPVTQSGALLANVGTNLPYAQRSVKEAYMETIIPLLKNFTLAKSLDFNGAIRRTDYSNSGTVTTWKGGLTWEPTPDFRLRGTRSRDIRAPNLVELYSPVASLAPIPNDPRTALRGVPAMTNLPTSGGNSALKPEIANTVTFGVVFQPTALKRLNVSADYYRINIKGAITSSSAQAVVNNCLPGGVYNGGPFCSLITFANNDVVNGQITAVSAALANVAEFRTHGVDMQLSYAQPLKDLMAGLSGTLNVNIQGTRVFEYSTSTDISALFPNGVNRADQSGAVFGGPAGLPKWMWATTLSYKLNRLNLNGQVRYISRGHQDNSLVGPDDSRYNPALPNSVNNNIVPAYTLVNVGGSYDLGVEGRREVYFTINNLLDRAPPFPANGTAYYDLLGRAFKVGMRFTFD